MTRLHVNVDHVATLREARGTCYPDPLHAAPICEMAGASGITIDLREDRRHIKDRDLRLMRETVTTLLNLEMAATDEMVGIARELRPDICTLVPEKRHERTTEGGLAVVSDLGRISAAAAALREVGIRVSLFIDANPDEITASRTVGADLVELHTGDYCNASASERSIELRRIQEGAHLAAGLGLRVAAGHGLHYHNVRPIAEIPEVEELNIGHALIARAVFVGLDAAVRQMLGRDEGRVIIGLGVDVCPIERMAQILTRHGDTFVKRVFTDAEIAYAGTKLAQAERLAARWAAKEAAIKALGAPDGLHWKDLEVGKSPGGAPELLLHGRAREHAEAMGAKRSLITLSHAAGIAVAVVILEGEPLCGTHTCS